MPELRFGPRFVYAFLLIASAVGVAADMDKPHYVPDVPDDRRLVGHLFNAGTLPRCSAAADTGALSTWLDTVDVTTPPEDDDARPYLARYDGHHLR